MAHGMGGKTCLVTGGTSGVGRAIARGLARLGADVVIVGHERERGEQAARDLRRESGGGKVESLWADMSVMESVRGLASAFRAARPSLHVLSLNAGVLLARRQLTPDGLDRVLATNYLGPFYLVNLLADLLRQSAPARVTAVVGSPSSVRGATIRYNDINLEAGWSALRMTLQAAFAKVVFMYEAARRFAGSGVTFNVFHPGLVRSRLPRHLPWPLRVPIGIGELLFSTECPTGVFLASAPELASATGGFYVGRRAVSFEPPGADAEAGVRLWVLSEKLVGLS